MTDGDERPDADGNGNGNGDGDGDRILRLVGIGFAVFFVVGLGLIVLAGMFASGGGADVDPPQANWTAERINDTHVRITHVGGEPVQANNLIPVVGTTERAIRYDDRLVNGASITIAATTANRVVLYWKPGEGTRRVRLASWRRITDNG